MKPHRMVAYGLMIAGAVAASRAVARRHAWEAANIHAGLMLDWDDVLAVASRATPAVAVEDLLRRFRELGATHLSLPELSLNRLLQKGELAVAQGSLPDRVYLRASDAALAERVRAELKARLPHLGARSSRAKNPLISFSGDLPAVAEVGLGFDPAQADLARRTGLALVARPIGYSWVRPAMIRRTLDQAAGLGAKIVAVQGDLVPGHEFELEHTLAAMDSHGLHFAFFRESRHQKGDWFLAKSLAPTGRVILAHEFQAADMLPEDPASICYRWANLAVEAGVRLCAVRFFRVLHAADPLEALTYVRLLAEALRQAGFVLDRPEEIDLTPLQPGRDELALAMAGLSAAGAAGLAADLLPLPDNLKLAGLAASASILTGLPFLEKLGAGRGHAHSHPHPHDGHEHHPHGPQPPATAYAPKGLALAATVAFPAAAGVDVGGGPLTALAQSLAVGAAGATVLSAITAEADYLLGVEEFRGYNLDAALPLGLAAAGAALRGEGGGGWRRWLPLAGVALAAIQTLRGRLAPDLPGSLDREHRQAHTHHLSAFQRALGDATMALSPRPLRKWSLLAPLGAVAAGMLKRRGKDDLASLASLAAIAGQVALLTGFRHGQRPLGKTLEGRARGWALGAAIAGAVWLASSLFSGRQSGKCR
ncbi:MAG: DUF5693 family protein [Anaerolineae bacterium]